MRFNLSRKLIFITVFSALMLLGAAAVVGAEANDLTTRLETANPLLRLLSLYVLGIGLALTPCVYPMIGVTLGYFSSQKGFSGKRSALLALVYVLGIAVTYSILGTIAGLTGSLFGGIMQNKWVIWSITLLLVALALSMFGLYEIRPPSSIADKASGRSGIAGALIMGLIFGVVAGPCVAPVIGGLLAFVAKTQSAAIGFSSFFFMALGMGTPLFLLALFAAQMPTPGVWMTAVNKIAGFLLLLVAAYFAGPLLPKVVSVYLYPIIIVAAGLYLGFIDKSLHATSRMKTFFTVLGTVLILVGMFIALPKESKPTDIAGEIGEPAAAISWVPYSQEALQNAADEGKPVMLDFYADWCGVCQEYENVTFKDPKFVKAAEGFVTMRVDATDRNDPNLMDVLGAWDVVGLPTIVFIDAQGRQAGEKVIGVVPTAELIRRLDETREASSAAEEVTEKPAEEDAAELTWVPYSKDALKKAAADGKPVMLDFYADWCRYCHDYENITFKDPKFLEAVKGFVAMRVDASNRDNPVLPEVMQTWEIPGLPSIVFIDAKGREAVEKVVGVVPTGEIIRKLEETRKAGQ